MKPFHELNPRRQQRIMRNARSEGKTVNQYRKDRRRVWKERGQSVVLSLVTLGLNKLADAIHDRVN